MHTLSTWKLQDHPDWSGSNIGRKQDSWISWQHELRIARSTEYLDIQECQERPIVLSILSCHYMRRGYITHSRWWGGGSKQSSVVKLATLPYILFLHEAQYRLLLRMSRCSHTPPHNPTRCVACYQLYSGLLARNNSQVLRMVILIFKQVLIS